MKWVHQIASHRWLHWVVGVAIGGGLIFAPVMSAEAATTGIWAGEQLTQTFTLPPLTNLNSAPTPGEAGVTVTFIANCGVFGSSGIATVPATLVSATTNTFKVQVDVPSPEFGIMWTNICLSLALPSGGVTVSGGETSPLYHYVSEPPVGQLPEVPAAAALPFAGLIVYGGLAARRRAKGAAGSPKSAD